MSLIKLENDGWDTNPMRDQRKVDLERIAYEANRQWADYQQSASQLGLPGEAEQYQEDKNRHKKLVKGLSDFVSEHKNVTTDGPAPVATGQVCRYY